MKIPSKVRKMAGVPPSKVKGPSLYRDPVQLLPSFPVGVRKSAGLPKSPDLLKNPKPKRLLKRSQPR